ncbi:hypothetical protein AB5I41_30905 [Sphingomonas sp. MMS24-JH45]
MYHLARRETDRDGMAQAAQEVATLTENIRLSAHRNRCAAPLIAAGMQQVRGARI